MGMSASQARLLSITARISNNELAQQSIAFSKQRLTDSTEQVNDQYLDALAKTKFQIITGYNSSNPTYEDLTYNTLTGINTVAAGKQYILKDNSGKILVPKNIANAFENGNGNYNTFLKSLGYTQADIDTSNKVDAEQAIHEAWDQYFVSVGIKYEEIDHFLDFGYTSKTTIDKDTNKTYDVNYPTCKVAYLNNNDNSKLQTLGRDDNGYYAKAYPIQLTQDDDGNIYAYYITEEQQKALNEDFAKNGTTLTIDKIINYSKGGTEGKTGEDKIGTGGVGKYCTVLKGTVKYGWKYTDEQMQQNSELENEWVQKSTLPFEYNDDGTFNIIGNNDNDETYIYSLDTSSETIKYNKEDTKDNISQLYVVDGSGIDVKNFIDSDKAYLTPEVDSTGTYSYSFITNPDDKFTISHKEQIINYAGTTIAQRELYDYACAIAEAYYDKNSTINPQTKTELSNDSTKIAYYRNIFNQMSTCGYITHDKEEQFKETDWLVKQVQAGKLQINYYSTVDGKFVATSLDADESVTEKEDSSAILLAEQVYKNKMAKLESEDKQFDLQLNRLEAEHNALQTEYDSVKNVISKNVQNSFKTFNG